MTQMILHVSEDQKEFIDSEFPIRGFATPEEYVQALVQEARLRAARAKVEQMLEDGLNSGESTEWNQQVVDDLKREIRERASRRYGPTP